MLRAFKSPMMYWSEPHGVPANVVFNFSRRRSDVVIRLSIGQTELFADFCVPVQHKLAGIFAVRRFVIVAEQSKPQALLRQAASQLCPALAGRSLSHVEYIDGNLLVHEVGDIDYAVDILGTARKVILL